MANSSKTSGKVMGRPINSKPQRFTAWSYTRWKDFTRCAFYAKCKYLDKLPEPASEAMERGLAAHKDSENYLKGIVRKLPESLRLLAKNYKQAKKAGAIAEENWAFRSDWTTTGWFDRDAWLRVKADLYFPIQSSGDLCVVDLKTGKMRDGYADQLELSGLAALILLEPKAVVPENWYADTGQMAGINILRQERDVEPLKSKWELRAQNMLKATTFIPTPNPNCRWCAFAKDRGGPCKFNSGS